MKKLTAFYRQTHGYFKGGYKTNIQYFPCLSAREEMVHDTYLIYKYENNET